MMPRLTVRLLLLGVLAFAFIGCGDSETVTIQFPEGVAVPADMSKSKATAKSSATSQGDPSQYTR